jgi:hypothetical protein
MPFFIGDAHYFRGKPLSGDCVSGEVYVCNGSFFVPEIPASGAYEMASGASGLSAQAYQWASGTSGLAQSGYNMGSGASGVANGAHLMASTAASYSSGAFSAIGSLVEGLTPSYETSGIILNDGSHGFISWRGVPVSGWCLKTSGTDLRTCLYWAPDNDGSGLSLTVSGMASGASGLAVQLSGDLSGLSGYAVSLSGWTYSGLSGLSGADAAISGWAFSGMSGLSGMDTSISGIAAGGSGIATGASGMASGGSGLASATSGWASGVFSGLSGMDTSISGIAQSGLDLASSGATGATLQATYTQASHGFASGNPLYRKSDSTWALAKADAEATAEAAGIVQSVNGNDFTIVMAGKISGLGGLTDGSVYYVSAATAGLLTATEPDPTVYFSKPMMVATSASGGIVLNMRAMRQQYGQSGAIQPDVVGGRIEFVNSGQIKWAFTTSNQIRLWNPNESGWQTVAVASEPTLAYNFTDLSGWAASGLKCYDIFAEWSSSTAFTLVANPWNSTSARWITPAQFEGVYCYDNTTASGKARRLLGTVYMATGPIFREDASGHFVDSLYHRRPITLLSKNTTATTWYWPSGATFVEFYSGSGQIRAEMVFCQSGSISAVMNMKAYGITGDAQAQIGIDSLTAGAGSSPYWPSGFTACNQPGLGRAVGEPGYHYVTGSQKMTSGSGQFYSYNGGSASIVVDIWG